MIWQDREWYLTSRWGKIKNGDPIPEFEGIMKIDEKSGSVGATKAPPQKAATSKWVPFVCALCGMGPDPARALVVDGVVVKVEGDPKFKDQWRCPAGICVKAQSIVQKVYYPTELKHP